MKAKIFLSHQNFAEVFVNEFLLLNSFSFVSFFAELLIIIKEKFFNDGKPVNSTVALKAGDFKRVEKQ